MGLYNFHERFAARVLAGTKRHTIRAPRKHPDQPGNVLHLYTGLRRKGAKLLARVQCTSIDEITIGRWGEIAIGGNVLSEEESETLARLDGFEDLASMLLFWDSRLPFHGQIIFWGPL